MWQGYIQKLLGMDCQVFIPFICKRCGECCRKVGVDLANINPSEVAKHLGISEKEVIERYLGETFCKGKKIKYMITKSRIPCPFLQGNECLIHPVKPDACKGFPVTTDFGDHGIGCPGEEEANRTIHILGRGISYFASPIDIAEEIYIPDQKWEKIVKKYLASHPSKEALELFLKFNQPSSDEKAK